MVRIALTLLVLDPSVLMTTPARLKCALIAVSRALSTQITTRTWITYRNIPARMTTSIIPTESAMDLQSVFVSRRLLEMTARSEIVATIALVMDTAPSNFRTLDACATKVGMVNTVTHVRIPT